MSAIAQLTHHLTILHPEYGAKAVVQLPAALSVEIEI
jgi:hypothetical protein